MRFTMKVASRLDSTRSRLALSILTLAKRGPLVDVLHGSGVGLDLGHGRHRAGIRDPAGFGDADEVDGRGGVARLPAGLAIGLVVQHHDGEVGRLLQADGGKAAHPHQHLAVAGDHDHRQLRLRQRDAEARS